MNEHVISFDIPAEAGQLERVSDELAKLLTAPPCALDNQSLIYGLQLATHEVCTNIIEHAYAGIAGRITIVMTLTFQPRRLIIHLYDQGRSFDLANTTTPDLDEAHEGGYGLVIVRAIMDDLAYESHSNGNCWRLAKNLD